MIIDDRAEFCDALAANGSGVDQIVTSGDIMDLSTVIRDIGQGTPVYLVVTIDTAASGGTSVDFQLRASTATNLATNPITLARTGAIAVASLTAGAVFVVPLMWINDSATAAQHYMGMWFTTVGAVTACKINAFLTITPERYVTYNDASVIGTV